MAKKARSARKLKVYIMTDLEGASGLVSARDGGSIGTEGSESYQRVRHLLTADVNAAIEGAVETGAGTIIVNDAHGTVEHNVFPDELDARAELERPVPGNWMPTLDAGYDALFFVGAHAMAGTRCGFLDHTQSSRHIFDWFLNGMRVGEIGQMAAIAGHFGVPLVFVSGDRAAVDEARELMGAIETVAVKEGLSRNYARGLHPLVARDLIRANAAKALALTDSVQPLELRKPITMRIVYTRSDYAEEKAARLGRGAKLLDARTVEVKLKDITDMFR